MEIKKALTLRASSIGDCLMGKYLLENIHVQFPRARCGLLVAGRAGMIRGLLAAYPWLEVLEVNRRHPLSLWSSFKKYFGSDATVTQYSAEGQFSFPSKLFARLITKRGRLTGFSDGFFLNKLIFSQLLSYREGRAVFAHEQDALKSLGLRIEVPKLTLFFFEHKNVLERFALSSGEYLVVHMFSGNEGRGLSPVRQRELVATLFRHFGKTFKLVLTGGVNNVSSALVAAAGLNVVIAVGQTTMPELINLLASSRMIIAVDTGVAHIAAHLSKPVIVMVSCPAQNWWLPQQYYGPKVFCQNKSCAGGHRRGKFPDCINQINFEDIVATVSKLISHE